MYSPFEDPSLRLISSKPKMVNEKAVTKQHEEALKILKEVLMDEKIFGNTNEYLFFSLLNNNGVLNSQISIVDSIIRQLQQKLIQAQSISDDDERNKLISKLYVDFGMLQVEIYSASIESIEAGNQVVEERLFIDEWLKNTEKETFAKLKEHIDKNKEAWKTPPQLVECDNCKKENTLSIELDHSNFFAGA
jgi:hypothetical protein